MYSQYSYNQNNSSSTIVGGLGSVMGGGGNFGKGFVTQQDSMTLTGQGWVSANTPASAAANLAPPPQVPPTPPHMVTPDTTKASLSQLVSHYSAVYQYYSSQGSEQRQVAATLVSGTKEKDEAERRAAWADYYADQSSRAAHYYNDLSKNQKKQPSVKPPSAQVIFEIKPCSTPAVAAQNTTSLVNSKESSIAGDKGRTSNAKKSRWGQAKSETTAAEKDDDLPESLKKFVHRNLIRCHDDSQRSIMQEQIEAKIRDAILKGDMQTKNWHKEPLIPVSLGVNKPKTFAVENNVNSFFSGNQNVSSFRDVASSSSIPSKSPQTNAFYSSFRDVASSSSIPSKSPQTNAFYSSLALSNISKKSKNKDSDKKISHPQDMNNEQQGNQSKKHWKTKENYDQKLPENDSYYGNPSGSTTSTRQGKSDNAVDWKPKTNFNQTLQENDSYYGNLSDSNTSTGRSDGIEDDYISLNHHSYSKQFDGISKSRKHSKLQKHSKKRKVLVDGFERSVSKLAHRANRFSGQGGIEDVNSSEVHSNTSNGYDRYMGKSVIGGRSTNVKVKLDEEDFEKMTVKGTCQVLEKEYLRLTAPPRAELVRPQVILEQHLKDLKARWDANKRRNNVVEEGAKKKEYTWFCSQLKAIRQDLTVQRIFNSFSVDVYETHARIALEEGDLNEFNQSQTQLKELYEILWHSESKRSTVSDLRRGLENQQEFIAYCIIYHVFLMGNKKYDGGSSALAKIMLNLTPQQRSNPCVAHALNVRLAVVENDYHTFFRLHDNCPNMGTYLMDTMVPQMRALGLQLIVKAYRPTIAVDFVLEELGFGFNRKVSKGEGKDWLKSFGCKLNDDESLILTKDSVLNETFMLGNRSSSLI